MPWAGQLQQLAKFPKTILRVDQTMIIAAASYPPTGGLGAITRFFAPMVPPLFLFALAKSTASARYGGERDRDCAHHLEFRHN